MKEPPQAPFTMTQLSPTGWIDLSDRLKLVIRGTDATAYLQGQLSNDVRLVADRHAIRCCILTAKGKLCGEGFLRRTPEDDYLLDADAALTGTLPARLERYVISEDVTIEDRTADLALLHLLGEQAQLPRPDATLAVACYEASRYGVPGQDWVFPSTNLPGVLEFLQPLLARLSDEQTEALRMERGIPAWGKELDEDTLPPEAGLDADAISYHKGCYIGQEVISRIRSVGRVNRRLRGFIAAAGRLPAVGSELRDPQTSVVVGKLTSVGWSFALECPVALGYLKTSCELNSLEAVPSPGSDCGSDPTASVAVEVKPFPISTTSTS